MKRNLDKFSKLGRDLINPRDDLSLTETGELFKRAHHTADAESTLDVITTAFYMGYAVGFRRASANNGKRITTVGEYLKETRRAGSDTATGAEL